MIRPFFNWLRHLIARPKTIQRKRSTRRHTFEQLEARIVPATLQTLATFGNPLQPTGTLVEDTNGNLYGTTTNGGSFGTGTIFEVVQGPHNTTTLASFNATSSPTDGLVIDNVGNLFGTASGGANGIVFELPHGSNSIATYAAFNGTNGSKPMIGLTIDSKGDLFGTTTAGGSSGSGVIFEIVSGTKSISVLASLNSIQSPCGRLLVDNAGNLFCNSSFKANISLGSLFELPHGSSTVNTLVTFNGTNGNYPTTDLVQDNSGNIYGSTRFGGTSVIMALSLRSLQEVTNSRPSQTSLITEVSTFKMAWS